MPTKQCRHALAYLWLYFLVLVLATPLRYDHDALANTTGSTGFISAPLVKRVDADLLTAIGVGREFYVPIMLADAQEVVNLINARDHVQDAPMRPEGWQRDDQATVHALTNSRRWERLVSRCSLQPVARALKALKVKAALKGQADFAEDRCWSLVQNTKFRGNFQLIGGRIVRYAGKGHAVTLEPTNAKFEVYLDSTTESLTILQAQSPIAIIRQRKQAGSLHPLTKGMPGLPVPVLSRFSDLMFAEARQRGSQEHLRFVANQSIRGPPETLAIITAIIASFKAPHNKLSQWPGISISVGDWAFDALLASTDFKGLAWFAFQHRQTYQHSAFTKAFIFRGDGDDDDTPSIIWELERVTPEVRQAAKDRREQGLLIGVHGGARLAPDDPNAAPLSPPDFRMDLEE